MKKIPPSERIRKQIEALFAGEGWQDQVDLISKVLYLGAQQLAQEVLEQEVTGPPWTGLLREAQGIARASEQPQRLSRSKGRHRRGPHPPAGASGPPEP
jgi:hypothetical protein